MSLFSPVFLIGYRCTGKTTTGRLLAKMMNRPFVDTDHALESQFNISIASMVKTNGWEYFRKKETQVLAGINRLQGPVVATGGGIVLAPENRALIRESGRVVWLYADEPTLISRILADANSATQRPDLTQDSLEEETRNMLRLRVPLYRELAQFTINTAEHSPKESAQLIKRRLDHDRF